MQHFVKKGQVCSQGKRGDLALKENKTPLLFQVLQMFWPAVLYDSRAHLHAPPQFHRWFWTTLCEKSCCSTAAGARASPVVLRTSEIPLPGTMVLERWHSVTITNLEHTCVRGWGIDQKCCLKDTTGNQWQAGHIFTARPSNKGLILENPTLA